MVIPKLLTLLPQHISIMSECLIVAALLETRLSKLAHCCAALTAGLPSFSYSRLRQSHAERAYEPLFTRRALIVGNRAVYIRLDYTGHMDVA